MSKLYNAGAQPQSKEYIYAGSQLVATDDGVTLTYHHADHLSARVNTNSAGTVVGEQGHYPFGESWYTSNSTSKWQFTTYERDSESGLDYAIFRYNSPRLGRFLTPDPVAGNMSNPQRLNRYAYSGNDPINRTDPMGLDWFDFWMDISNSMAGLWGPSFGQWANQFDTAGFLGYAYWDLPGNWDFIAQEEYRHGWIIYTGLDPAGLVGDTPDEYLAKLKGALGELFKNPACAALVGGSRRATQLVDNLNIIDITSQSWIPRADHRSYYETLLLPWVAAVTIPGGVGSPIWVGNVFNALAPTEQLVVLIHELRHQIYDLGEPNPGTKGGKTKYERWIRREYNKIRKACFPKKTKKT